MQSFIDAYQAKDMKQGLCQLTTTRFIRSYTGLGAGNVRKQCEGIVSQVSLIGLPELPAGVSIKDVSLKGKRAFVTVETKGYRDSVFKLKQEGGSFKIDDFSYG